MKKSPLRVLFIYLFIYYFGGKWEDEKNGITSIHHV